MTTKHSIKRQLIASILCFCLCFTSLIGTTFAWFTDEVTSSGNIIQTGTLDVEMHWANGGDAVPTDKSGWTNAASGEMFNYTKWEPGYTEAKHIKISNVGTLALKYQLRIVSSSELTKLADVIDVYYYDTATEVDRDSLSESDRLGTLAEVIDASHSKALFKTVRGSLESGEFTTLTLVLKMREGAGNEYQGLYLNGGFSIQLLAAQYTSDTEKDSWDNMYDEDAQYPVVTTPAYVLPTDKFTAFSFNTTDMKVTAPADFAAELANAGVTAVTFKASDVVVKDGVATIANADFYDQNGVKIELTNNSEPITVKLYVGDAYKGQSVVVSHDDKIVASTTVDDEGYVTYNTTHFCKITVELDKKIPEGSIIVGGEVIDPDKVEEIDPKTPVEMTVGSHVYTVSYGMASTWLEYENVPGKIEADVYLPEDLYAFSMMYKNGDLAETGSHSDLKIKADLDFKNKKWEPIGRFFTNIHGNNHTISNLSDSFLGCVYDCQVYNLTLEGVTATSSAAGVLAKELAGDAKIENVTIAGNNKITFVDDGKTNWPESGYGIGAIAGVSLVGCSAPANVDVTITGEVVLNYGENAIFYNASRCENLGITKELGLNVYMPNAGVNVKGSEKIRVEGNCYMLLTEKASDGKYDIVDGVAISPDGKTYALLNEAGLKWFADYVNAGNTTNGYTFNLLADVDLEDEEWTPIGYMGKTFKGTFDGNNHTVKNLKITKTLTNAGVNNGIGFFGRTDDPAEIKNLTIENVDITGSLQVGAVVGFAYTGKAIQNVTVKGDVFIDAWWYAGGIGGNGYMSNIENCRVIANPGSYVKGNGGSYIGAIWGFHGEGTAYINNCYAENIDISGVDRVGAISGIAHYGNEITNCKAKNVTVTATDAETTIIGLVAGACEGTASQPSVFKNNELINVRAFAGYIEVYNIYGTNIDGGTPVTNVAATIGNVTYDSIDDAMAAAPNGTINVTSGAVIDLDGKTYEGTLVAEGNLTIKGDAYVKTLKATKGGTITVEEGKTLTLNDFSFGSNTTAGAKYTVTGGKIAANYGFFQHGVYALYSDFETGYMYYSYGSDITVYGTFHSQGKGDGLDYVRGKLTVANGGKSIHDAALWVGQPASWGAMNAALIVEEGGYVEANTLSVYEGSVAYNSTSNIGKDGVGVKYNTLNGEVRALAVSSAELNTAIAGGISTMYLKGGSYAMANTAVGTTLKGIEGETVVLNNNVSFAGNASMKGAIARRMNFVNVTFENTVFTMNGTGAAEDGGGSCVFTDVTFAAGFRQGYGSHVTFNGCTFGSNSEGYALHFQTASSSAGGMITLNGCEFEGGKVHLGGARAYTFTNCDFAAGTDFQVWANVTLSGCTVDGVAVTGANVSTLFPNLNLAKVTVDGATVVSNTEELNAAVKTNAVIYLLPGEYELTKTAIGATLIGVNEETVKVNATVPIYGFTGKFPVRMHFESLTFTNTISTFQDTATEETGGTSCTFTNVTFAAGFRHGYGSMVVFTDCTFGSNSEGYALHFEYDEGGSNGEIKLTNCKFEGGKVHLGGPRTYLFDNCEFAAGTDFQVWTGATLDGCTVGGEQVDATNANTLFPALDLDYVTIK